MLSEYAIERDKASGLKLIPLKKIYADVNFNCRGQFTSADIVELARDVAAKGLIEPIIIRNLWATEEIQKKQGFEYSLVAGFRRYAAYRTNEAEVIPCVVRHIDNEFECRDINAVENLQRKDLNLAQEAAAIKHYYNANWTLKDVAEHVSKSTGWVQIRYVLLGMPAEIQQAAGQGYILSQDVLELNKYRENRTEMLKMAGVIRDARKYKTGVTNLTHSIKKKDYATTKKTRTRLEIFELMEALRNATKGRYAHQPMEAGDVISTQGNSLATSVLAWAAGEIDSFTLHTRIREFCDLIGVGYTMPEFSKESLLNFK